MFTSGSEDTTELCAAITLRDDSLVECDEDFTVELALVTLNKASLSIDSTDSTTVTITDSDSMLSLSLCDRHIILFVFFSCVFWIFSLDVHC